MNAPSADPRHDSVGSIVWVWCSDSIRIRPVQHTTDEGRRLQPLKRFDNSNKDDDSSPHVNNVIIDNSTSQKFREIQFSNLNNVVVDRRKLIQRKQA